MRTTHWVVYYFTNPNSWYPVLERARILLAIPEIQLLTHVCQWRHKAYGRWRTRCKHLSQQCVSSMSDRKQRWQEPELREKFSRSNRSASNALTARSTKKTVGNKTKRKMEYWSTIPRVMMTTFHLWTERLIFTLEEPGSRFGRSIHFNSRIVFS